MPVSLVRPFLVSGVLLLGLLPSMAGAAEKAAPISRDYAVEALTDSVFVIYGPLALPDPENQGFMNNPGFVETSDGIVVIDPGSSVQTGELLLSKIREISDKPVIASFSTHIHGDHWLGNQAIVEAWPDVKLYGHKNAIEKIANGEGATWVKLMQQLTGGATDGTRVVGPAIAVDDGDSFVMGGKTFQIIYKGPAHTTTDIMIRVVEDDTIFLGDNALNRRIGQMNDGNFEGLIKTLEYVAGLDAGIYVPGHGLSGNNEMPLHYKLFVETLYATVLEKYEEGLSDFEIIPFVQEALQPWSDWSGYDEFIGRLVSLTYLEIEENSF